MNTSSSMPKKAVHVKWAGKTIALGTFPTAEADEKCARAKALTRAWRSTMRPKPTREWVIHELERLNVRVVTGRSGKDDEFEMNDVGLAPMSLNGSGGMSHNTAFGFHPPLANIVDPNLVGRRGSITASLLNAADIARVNGGGGFGGVAAPRPSWTSRPAAQQGQSMNLVRGLDPSNPSMTQKNAAGPKTSTLGTSSSNAYDFNSHKEVGSSSSSSSNAVPPHRPLVGGGSAAAYEAARAEHYRQLAKNTSKEENNGSNNNSNTYDPDTSDPSFSRSHANPNFSTSMNALPNTAMMNVSNNAYSSTDGMSGPEMGGTNGRPGGLSLHASQHYEMLKLHHMNLLNEIQETTLMMNIYQQQMQQQEQQAFEMMQQQHQQQRQPKQEQQQPQEQEKHLNHGHVEARTVGTSQHPKDHNMGGAEPPSNDTSRNDYREDNQPTQKETEIINHHHPEWDTASTTTTTKIQNNDNFAVANSSREEQLAKIKAEIEERKRMLEDLSKDEYIDEEGKGERRDGKKMKISSV